MGRRVNDSAALTGIRFVLQPGLPWEYLPREPGVLMHAHPTASRVITDKVAKASRPITPVNRATAEVVRSHRSRRPVRCATLL
ncbi:hypothetical protein E1742_13440 [Pseudoduganella plicata]|uniref:Transposase n=1 Tax=Pseudoduganella plicata TaxID=321984 RepID=A0ABX5SBW7_9BURK|nr:hypothetical protein E1742_13440 [Pseudoduganella plicata]